MNIINNVKVKWGCRKTLICLLVWGGFWGSAGAAGGRRRILCEHANATKKTGFRLTSQNPWVILDVNLDLFNA